MSFEDELNNFIKASVVPKEFYDALFLLSAASYEAGQRDMRERCLNEIVKVRMISGAPGADVIFGAEQKIRAIKLESEL